MMNPNDFCVLTAAQSKSVRMVALAIALDAMGCQERPGHNLGVIVRATMDGHEGDPWCAAFVTKCYLQAAKMLCKPTIFPQLTNRFSSSAIYKWAKANGKLTNAPRNGDLFLVRGGPTGHEHTGMVANASADYIETIEGNIGDKITQRHMGRGGLDFVRVTVD
jgi:hypothetical protein